MKKISVILLTILPLIILVIIFFFNNKNSDTSMKQKQFAHSNNSNTENLVPQRITVPLNSSNVDNIDNRINTQPESESNEEIELSSFSTNILTADPNRNNNIRITCNVLNEHTVSTGETFSFTGLVGKSTSAKGYKEANIIDTDGDTIKGLGGGNCQVSSTLYNAVVAIPELEVIERHNHGAEVYYVPVGKDAAVAHGSIDFRFKNNLNSTIKIYASTDDKVVTIKINKIP